MAVKRVRAGGRPRLNRDRHHYNPRIERDVDDILRRQAEAAGMAYASYLELLISEAHDYHGQYLRELSVLPAAIQADELRRRTAAIESEDCQPISRKGESVRHRFAVDRPVANQIEARCDELSAMFTDYIRAIFREAAGNPRPVTHDQLSLSLEGQGRGLARAS